MISQFTPSALIFCPVNCSGQLSCILFQLCQQTYHHYFIIDNYIIGSCIGSMQWRDVVKHHGKLDSTNHRWHTHVSREWVRAALSAIQPICRIWRRRENWNSCQISLVLSNIFQPCSNILNSTLEHLPQHHYDAACGLITILRLCRAPGAAIWGTIMNSIKTPHREGYQIRNIRGIVIFQLY